MWKNFQILVVIYALGIQMINGQCGSPYPCGLTSSTTQPYSVQNLYVNTFLSGLTPTAPPHPQNFNKGVRKEGMHDVGITTARSKLPDGGISYNPTSTQNIANAFHPSSTPQSYSSKQYSRSVQNLYVNMFPSGLTPTVPPHPQNVNKGVRKEDIHDVGVTTARSTLADGGISYNPTSTLNILNAFQRQPSEVNTALPLEGLSTTKSFDSKLFEIMSTTAQNQNLVYSPISLQALLSFILTISEGRLNMELRQLLGVSMNQKYFANAFPSIINDPPTTLIMANKLYYDYRSGAVSPNLRNVALNSFASDLEQIDFQNSNNAANVINSWVSEKTRNLIRNIITPSTISPNTNAVLLNAIYFKSEWLNKFATYDTQEQQFNLNRQVQVPVEMMFNEDVFNYGDFPDLQASVVEMPYKTSDFTMMLILPKDIDGLRALEQKLSQYNLQSISQKLNRELVAIKLPKFKVEFDVDMIQPLQQLGVRALFNEEGKINIFENQQKPLVVDQFKHKSYISVNEAGTEAAAASFAKYVPLSIPVNLKHFVADHPFIFVIRNANAIFFMGHIVNV